MSFPLKLDGDTLGALSFYSKERDALRAGQREEGQLPTRRPTRTGDASRATRDRRRFLEWGLNPRRQAAEYLTL
jgi:hypothetical protein